MLYVQHYIKTVHFWLKYNGFAAVRKTTKLIEGGHRGFQDYRHTSTFFYVFWKSKKSWLFTFFCRASYVFSNYVASSRRRHDQSPSTYSMLCYAYVNAQRIFQGYCTSRYKVRNIISSIIRLVFYINGDGHISRRLSRPWTFLFLVDHRATFCVLW